MSYPDTRLTDPRLNRVRGEQMIEEAKQLTKNGRPKRDEAGVVDRVSHWIVTFVENHRFRPPRLPAAS